MFGCRALFAAGLRRHAGLLSSLAAGLFTFQLLIATVYATTVGTMVARLFSENRAPQFLRGLTGGFGDVFTPEGWIGFGYAHPLTLVMVVAWTVAVATSAVAGEVEDGTLEFVASRPVDRGVLIGSRMMVWVTGLGALLGAAYAGTAAGASLVEELAPFDRVRGLFLPSALIPCSLAIGGFAFLVSAISSTRARANAISIGYAVASYFLNFAAVIWRPLDPLAPLSVFHYVAPSQWMRLGITWYDVGIPGGFGIVLLVLAANAFRGRDIAP